MQVCTKVLTTKTLQNFINQKKKEFMFIMFGMELFKKFKF
jgi:hypothetical protein